MRTLTIALTGLDAVLVPILVLPCSGLRAVEVSGLPEPEERECRVRVTSALAACGALPAAPRAVRVGEGILGGPPRTALRGAGDLAVAVAVALSGGIDERLADTVFLGELSLDGRVRPVRGVLPALLAARRLGIRQAIVPFGNAAEAAAGAEGLDVRAASTLAEVLQYLRGEGVDLPTALSVASDARRLSVASDARRTSGGESRDLADLPLSPSARRAVEVAAAGGHGLLLVGPPGSGKVALARRLGGILPEWSPELRREATCAHSVAGLLGEGSGLLPARPFRAPHHTVSEAGLVGGGSPLRPGEVTLAHGGVLLLDEVGEFRQAALEALARAVREGRVDLSRGGERATFPAAAHLVGTADPCPCGRAGLPGAPRCDCTEDRRAAYWGRLRSSPVAPHLMVRATLRGVEGSALSSARPGPESSAAVRARVEAARAFYAARAGGSWQVDSGADELLARWAADHPRGVVPRMSDVLSVARTVADLAASETVSEEHAAEALALYPWGGP